MVLCTFAKGQNVSIDELISLRAKSLGSVEEFLTARKWEMISATEERVDTVKRLDTVTYKYLKTYNYFMGNVDFAYKKNTYNESAESFIHFYYQEKFPTSNRLSIQVHTVATYNLYIARIKVLGYKLKKSSVKDGRIIKVYEANKNIIRVTTSIQEQGSSNKTIYSFTIWDSISYQNEYIYDE